MSAPPRLQVNECAVTTVAVVVTAGFRIRFVSLHKIAFQLSFRQTGLVNAPSAATSQTANRAQVHPGAFIFQL